MKLKKVFIITITIFLVLFNTPSIIFAQNIEDPLNLTASGVILMDNKTNKILYAKNENDKMYPASTTKILTAIITLENCNLDDKVVAGYDEIMEIPEGYSTANIQVDEELTIKQLLEMLLVYSANDAANVLAKYIGGSLESFSSIMNTKLNEIGLKNTHFTNAYGRHDEKHYTTAYDLALLMQYCMKNDEFRRIAGLASCAIPATNKSEPRLYNSTDLLIIPNNENYYQYATIGKTGFTSQAKYCLVSCSYKNDIELIGVVLGSDTNRFAESKALYEYGYSHFSLRKLISNSDVGTSIEVKNATKDTKNLNLLANSNINVLINNDDIKTNFEPEIILDENISAPIEEGTVLGSLKYTIDGLTYETQLIASHNVIKSKFFDYILYIVLAMLVLVIIYIILFGKKRKKNI